MPGPRSIQASTHHKRPNCRQTPHGGNIDGKNRPTVPVPTEATPNHLGIAQAIFLDWWNRDHRDLVQSGCLDALNVAWMPWIPPASPEVLHPVEDVGFLSIKLCLGNQLRFQHLL